MTNKTTKLLPLSISPSQWQVWGKCALSLQSPKSPFTLATDDYADSGTNLHTIIAEGIKNPSKDSDGKTPVVGDDAPLVRFAVETTLAEYRPGYKTIVEHYLALKKSGVLIGGTADCIIAPPEDAVDGEVVIFDHKTGWKEVEAEGNLQLKIYAHLYAALTRNITSWRGVIINARFNSTSYTGGEIDPKFLSSLVANIKKRTTEKQYAVGNHCAYCPRLSICKPLRSEILRWLTPGAIDSLTREPDRLGEALKLAKPAEKLFDTIKKEAQLFIDLGGIIPGVSIEFTSGTRAWPRDLSTEGVASAIGLSSDQMIEEKTVSPAEAERRGADKEAINAIAIRPPRKGFKFS